MRIHAEQRLRLSFTVVIFCAASCFAAAEVGAALGFWDAIAEKHWATAFLWLAIVVATGRDLLAFGGQGGGGC